MDAPETALYPEAVSRSFPPLPNRINDFDDGVAHDFKNNKETCSLLLIKSLLVGGSNPSEKY